MNLVKVTNGNKHPKSNLNIEMAHVAVDETGYLSKLKQAYIHSVEVERMLGLNRYNFRIARSILVDDKRRPEMNRNTWFDQICEGLPELANGIDYIAFESDLKNMLNIFYSRVRPEKQVNVKNEIERYLAKRKRTACSHDIALWHSLRLGALGGKGLPVYEISTTDRKNKGLCSSFIATNVCSILPYTDRLHEEDAETDILRHLDRRYGDWRRVKRYYYEI